MIYLRYFAKYREWLGVSEEVLVDVPVDLARLLPVILENHPNALKMLEDPRCIVAVNQQVVHSRECALKPGDEVAFYPPVTGG